MQRTLDTLALYGICAVLGVAFYYQFGRGELPCPLCALQRVGFVVAGVGLILNLRSGYSPAHYGLALLSAVAAGSASLRQISLHVSKVHIWARRQAVEVVHQPVLGQHRQGRQRRIREAGVEVLVEGRPAVSEGPQARQRLLLVGQQPRPAPPIAPPQAPPVGQHRQDEGDRPC